MRHRRDIAYDIRRAIHGCENFHLLRDEANQDLLKEACEHLLNAMVTSKLIDPTRKTFFLGPETMGAVMIGELPNLASGIFSDLCTVKLVKTGRRLVLESGKYEDLKNAQIVWMDDTLRRGDSIKEAMPKLRPAGLKITAIAVLMDYCYLCAEGIIPAGKIVSVEKRDSE